MQFANIEPIDDSNRLTFRDRVDSQESSSSVRPSTGAQTTRSLLMTFLAFTSLPLSIFQFVIIPYAFTLQEELKTSLWWLCVLLACLEWPKAFAYFLTDKITKMAPIRSFHLIVSLLIAVFYFIFLWGYVLRSTVLMIFSAFCLGLTTGIHI